MQRSAFAAHAASSRGACAITAATQQLSVICARHCKAGPDRLARGTTRRKGADWEPGGWVLVASLSVMGSLIKKRRKRMRKKKHKKLLKKTRWQRRQQGK